MNETEVQWMCEERMGEDKGDTVGIDNLSMKQTREMGQGLEGDTG